MLWEDFKAGFGTLGRSLQATWHFRTLPYKMRTAVLVTKTDHCLNEILLRVPLPPDADVPVGTGSDGNVELRRWAPSGWDFSKTFEQNKGFKPRSHLELCEMHRLVDFPRGVKMAGSRSYVLTGDGMRLHQAVLRFAVDFMTNENGFTPMSVPVLVREEAMVGTGFFPAGREQAYEVNESQRGGGYDMFLTGTDMFAHFQHGLGS